MILFNYVKEIMAKTILEYCNQDDIFDEGTGWYKISEAIFHTPTKDENNLKEQLKKMDSYHRYGNFSITKQTKNKFGLKTFNTKLIKKYLGLAK